MELAASRRRRRRLTALLVGLAAMMLAAAPAASAHAVLQSSTPSPGSVAKADASVAMVELTFNEPVEASIGSVQVINGGGVRVDAGTVKHPAGAGDRVAVHLRSGLSQGSYLVLWRVVSADSHPVHGSFTFAIGHPGAVAATTGVSTPRSVALALGVARFAGYAGALVIVGMVAFLLLCQPRLWSYDRTRTLWAGALIVAAAATAVGFALQAAADVGGGWSAALDGAELQALSATRLGHAHVTRLLLLPALWLADRRRGGVAGRLLLAPLTLALVGTIAIEGHGGRDVVTMVVDIVHITAAGAWLGGLLVLVALVLPQYRLLDRLSVAPGSVAVLATSSVPVDGPSYTPVDAARPSDASPAGGALAVLERAQVHQQSWTPVSRFSAVAAAAVAVLVLTGVLQSVRQVPEWGALAGTTYGRELLLKIGLVAVTLAVAGCSTIVLHTHLGGSEPHHRARLLSRTVATETGLASVVLAVTSALVATTPAAAAYRPAQERTVHAGPITVEVSAAAPAARTLDIHLYAYGADGALADVTKMSAEASPPVGLGLGPITLPLLQAGTGHFLASRLLLPHAGRWTLTLVVQSGDFDAYTTATSVIVR